MARLRILLAEDETLLAGLIRGALEEAGYEVVAVPNGREAVSRAGRGGHALFLTDLSMPRMGGLDAIREIRAMRALAKLPVMVLTADGERGTVLDAVRAGANDYVVKAGLDMAVLVARIGKMLGREGSDPSRPARAAEARRPPAEEEPRAAPEADARPPRGRVEARLKQVVDLKALPFVAAELVHLTASAGAGAKQLADTILRDAALTAKVLKVANSSFYSGRGRCQTLTQAVSQIGFRGIREIALAVQVLDDVGRVSPGGLDRIGLWRQSLACGVLARNLAEASGSLPEHIEWAFLVGLLHDAGIPVLADLFPAAYAKVLEGARTRASLSSIETEVFGIDHAGVAGRLLTRWGFPGPIVETIAKHHLPWKEAAPSLGEGGRLLALLHASDALVQAAGIGRGVEDVLDDVAGEIAERVAVPPARIAPLLDGLAGQVKALAQVLLLHLDAPIGAGLQEGPPEQAGPLVAYCVDLPGTIDPVRELLARRWRCEVRDAALPAGAWADARPGRLVVRMSSPEALGVALDSAEEVACGPGSPRPRWAVLAPFEVPSSLRSRWEGIGGLVLPLPCPAGALARALSLG